MSRERKLGIFMSVLVKKQKVQKYGQCRVNANLALFMSVVVKKQEVQKYGQCRVNANFAAFCIFFHNKYTNLVVTVYKSMGIVAW